MSRSVRRKKRMCLRDGLPSEISPAELDQVRREVKQLRLQITPDTRLWQSQMDALEKGLRGRFAAGESSAFALKRMSAIRGRLRPGDEGQARELLDAYWLGFYAAEAKYARPIEESRRVAQGRKKALMERRRKDPDVVDKFRTLKTKPSPRKRRNSEIAADVGRLFLLSSRRVKEIVRKLDPSLLES